MKKVRMAAIGVIAGLALAFTGLVPALDAVQTADARNGRPNGQPSKCVSRATAVVQSAVS
jgi:hypothetical protein